MLSHGPRRHVSHLSRGQRASSRRPVRREEPPPEQNFSRGQRRREEFCASHRLGSIHNAGLRGYGGSPSVAPPARFHRRGGAFLQSRVRSKQTGSTRLPLMMRRVFCQTPGSRNGTLTCKKQNYHSSSLLCSENMLKVRVEFAVFSLLHFTDPISPLPSPSCHLVRVI